MAIPVLKMITIGLLPSPLKVAWYRFRGARIGKRVSIGLLSVIDAETIEIGDDTRIGLMCFLNLKKSLKLGKRVRLNAMVAVDTGSLSIDNDSTIMEQVIIGGMLTPRSTITIGKRVKVFPHAFLNPTYEITIEDDVGVGGASYIFTHGSWQSVLDGFVASFGPVHIKRNAWLAWRVFITAGVTIGESAILGAGSVVNENVPDGGVASGVPAKVIDYKGRHIRKLTPAHKFKMLTRHLTEFAEYETWLNRPCSVVSKEPTEVRLTHAQGNIVLKIDAVLAYDHTAKVLVSLDPIGLEIRQAIEKSGGTWLDIASKEANVSTHVLGNDVRNFLSRYGIRFELLD